MSDQNDFDIMSDPLVQAPERVADELERMAEIAFARNFTEEEVDAYAQQAIISGSVDATPETAAVPTVDTIVKR